MRFLLIDRITELEPQKSITAVKNLSLAEEYLADHFPGFPVMPGVLMLETLVQAGGWLIRHSEDFAQQHGDAERGRVRSDTIVSCFALSNTHIDRSDGCEKTVGGYLGIQRDRNR